MVFQVFCLLLLLFICHSLSLVTALNEEGLALLSFKQSLIHYPEASFQRWNASDENPCLWHGVTCRESKVVYLNIPNRRLSGPLHPSLGKLSKLRYLDLRKNGFYGSLPIELFNAKNLTSLVLSENSLTGSLPSQIRNLHHLQTLDLSKNKLSGSLPDGIGTSLSKLQKLNLSFNRLSGSIPNDMANLCCTRGIMDLSHNMFSGSIPSSLGNLPEKFYIDFSYNNLTGAIPQKGILQNIGPTAYKGNTFLCGLPLDVSCSSSTVESTLNPNGEKQRSRKFSVIAIVTGVSGAVFIFGFLAYFWYKKRGVNPKRKFENPRNPENMGKYRFVRMDKEADFDLEGLLKGTAYLESNGGRGDMYKVALENGRWLAVRSLGDESFQGFKEFKSKVEAIGKARHPNIVRLLAYCWSVDEKLLVYDYIPNGDLTNAIHGKEDRVSFTPLSWPDRLRIIKGIARGLAYLHKFGTKKNIHGDLNPTNILLGHNMEPYISDFGLARLTNLIAQSEPRLNNGQLSYYQAPEATSKSAKPSQKWDVYSFGMILLEITSSKLPLIQVGSSKMELVRWIEIGIDDPRILSCALDPSLASHVHNEEVAAVLKIALDCVHKSPERRPCMRFVHDFLDKLPASND